MLLGYKAAAEQFGPRELLDLAIAAEHAGFDSVLISDHAQPWRHTGGHAPHALAWLAAVAQRTERVLLGTSVLAPTFRHHPAVLAQAAATMEILAPRRLLLGLGTGESMNEVPVLGIEWPAFPERLDRLAEAVKLMRRLWTEERVTFDGTYFRTDALTVYDRPDRPVPIWLAASGPQAARLAGRVADGYISTSSHAHDRLRDTLLVAVDEGAREAGRSPNDLGRLIEIKLAWADARATAIDATRFWAALALPTEAKHGISDPREMERRAGAVLDQSERAWLVTTDPDEIVARVAEYVVLGYRHLVFHSPLPDQLWFIDSFGRRVMPLLRERFG